MNAFKHVVLFLGGTLVLAVAGVIALAISERPIPDILENVIVGCLTGLAGLLARTPTDGPQSVVVENDASDPVPTTESADDQLTLGNATSSTVGATTEAQVRAPRRRLPKV